MRQTQFTLSLNVPPMFMLNAVIIGSLLQSLDTLARQLEGLITRHQPHYVICWNLTYIAKPNQPYWLTGTFTVIDMLTGQSVYSTFPYPIYVTPQGHIRVVDANGDTVIWWNKRHTKSAWLEAPANSKDNRVYELATRVVESIQR